MNNVITLEQAIKMTTLYREQKKIIISPDFQGQEILSISESFDRAAFDKLLSQTGCVGLRIYYGMSEDLKIKLIIVGVNENNEDMLPASANSENTSGVAGSTTTESGEEDEEEVIIEDGNTCPPICPPPSPLNP